MKLLIVSLNGDPLADLGSLHAGGQCKYILELGKNLVGLGWDIDVLTFRNRGAVTQEKITEGFCVYRVPRPNEQDYDYDVTLDELEELANRLGDESLCLDRYALALCCYWLSGFFLTILDPDGKLPRVLTLCSLGEFKLAIDRSAAVYERCRVEKELVRTFDCIIATNTAERRALIELYSADPAKIHLIARGVDLEMFGEYREFPLRR